VIRAHQPGSEPIDIPETIPNPVVVPKPTPTPTEPAPKEPVRMPEKVHREALVGDSLCQGINDLIQNAQNDPDVREKIPQRIRPSAQ
jgi:hypothetical protein